MVWNAHGTSFILTIPDRNRKNLNLFDNFGHLSTAIVQSQATNYIEVDTRKTQNND